MFKLNRDEIEFLIVLSGWINRSLGLVLSIWIILGLVLGVTNELYYIFILATLALLSSIINLTNIAMTTLLSGKSKCEHKDHALDLFIPDTVDEEPRLSIRQKRLGKKN